VLSSATTGFPAFRAAATGFELLTFMVSPVWILMMQ